MSSLIRIVVPKRYVPVMPGDIIFYLAGPVRGGGDWQRFFIEGFLKGTERSWTHIFRTKMFPRIKFIVPCRWGTDHPLSEYFVTQYESPSTGDQVLDSQTAMERLYLRSVIIQRNASKILFGLFPEDSNNPRPKDSGPYACDTYGELGRWTTIARYEGNSLCIQIACHPGFPGSRTIMRNLLLDSQVKGNQGDCFSTVINGSPFDEGDRFAERILPEMKE